MKPESLGDIYKRTNSERFRVRDIKTLRDYLCLEVTVGPMGSMPKHCYTICCEDHMKSNRDACETRYILLSTIKEVEQMKRLKEPTLIAYVLEAYDKSEYP